MAYKMKTDLAHSSNYGSSRSLSKIKYIVIHYTANDGDTDENNGNYFNGANKKASAHYFVDDDSVTQSVPDNYVAWHCGGGLQGSGGHTFYQKCTNTNSIGIEICDDVKNGEIYPSAKTIENVIEFTKTLMKKYNVPASNVIRHYDVTGKSCPAYWCGSDVKNKKWKTEFWNKLSSNTSTSSSAQPSTSTSSTSSAQKLTVNGIWNKTLTKRLQEIFKAKGYAITVDGIISNQWKCYKDENPGLTTGWEWKDKPNGKGSMLIKAMQKWAGVKDKDCDGEMGPGTIKKLQAKLGTTQDGCVSNPSSMVKALQNWANKQ